MQKLITISVAALLSVALSSSAAFPFGLGGLTRDHDGNRFSFLQEKDRTPAPFAHVMFCVHEPEDCTASSGVKIVDLTRAKRRELIAVNAEINREIAPANDVGDDQWTLAPVSGDCDDYAITKRHTLIARGWPAAALRLAVAYTSWGEGHLVLVVRTSKGDLVLDNMTGAIRSWRKTGLRWEMIQAADDPKIWYRL
jgi:predicted transglutaminase-like cysteine proteinase